MKKQQISSGIGRRAGFFHYFFEKNMTCIGEYRSVTAMIFDKREAKTILQQTKQEQHSHVSNIENHSHLQRVNEIHRHSELHTHIEKAAPEKEQTSRPQTEMREKSESEALKHAQRDFYQTVVNRFMKVTGEQPSVKKEKETSPKEKRFHLSKETERVVQKQPLREGTPVTALHQRENKPLSAAEFELLEARIVTRLEEKIVKKTETKKEQHVTYEAHVLKQREEKKMADKVYRMVAKRRDKELRRKGYLYE